MSDLSMLLHKYKKEKIALYGLSVETEKVLKQIGQKVTVIGLLDGYREDGELYEVPIIPLQQAIDEGVRLIIVVARPGSCKAIARRIGKICIENRIALRDVNGKDLCNLSKVVYDFKGINGMTKRQFKQMVSRNEVISVDLFDTLIMRQTFLATDVFELVDSRLKEQGVFIERFCGKRLESEKYLAQIKQSTLEEIYAYMIEKYHIPDVDAKQLAELEWEIDRELLVPRYEVCKLLNKASTQGKKIYIVSDTYYNKSWLIEILNKCGITFYTDIFASCEYKTGKKENLFGIVREKLGRDSWLHIGDDSVADIEAAHKKGLETCQLYSGADLLEMAGYLGLWDCTDSIQNRIKTGMFVSRLFNSPFQFETEEKIICVDKSCDIGYLFFAPMITDFVLWLSNQVKKYKIANIWFGARDGYLIKKLYDLYSGKEKTVYFLTSRIAAIRAGMDSEEDIRSVAEMKYSGSLRGQLRERFGIQIQNLKEKEKQQEDILQYTELILQCTEEKRSNYQKYINTLGMSDETEIAFFDFVAKGTTQMYLSRFVQSHIKGFYFLRLEEEQMCDKNLDIHSFYSEEERIDSAIFDNYYILETILTSPEPSILEFDEWGKPVYALETRSARDIVCSMAVQQGIMDYFQTYLKICPRECLIVDKTIDEVLLRLIHRIAILDEDFKKLNIEDPFFNRMTKITDVI